MEAHLKKYPKGTSKAQWDQYEKELIEFDRKMNDRKPRLENYTDYSRFEKDMAEWRMALHCDCPNEPGYYRSNND